MSHKRTMSKPKHKKRTLPSWGFTFHASQASRLLGICARWCLEAKGVPRGERSWEGQLGNIQFFNVVFHEMTVQNHTNLVSSDREAASPPSLKLDRGLRGLRMIMLMVTHSALSTQKYPSCPSHPKSVGRNTLDTRCSWKHKMHQNVGLKKWTSSHACRINQPFASFCNHDIFPNMAWLNIPPSEWYARAGHCPLALTSRTTTIQPATPTTSGIRHKALFLVLPRRILSHHHHLCVVSDAHLGATLIHRSCRGKKNFIWTWRLSERIWILKEKLGIQTWYVAFRCPRTTVCFWYSICWNNASTFFNNIWIFFLSWIPWIEAPWRSWCEGGVPGERQRPSSGTKGLFHVLPIKAVLLIVARKIQQGKRWLLCYLNHEPILSSSSKYTYIYMSRQVLWSHLQLQVPLPVVKPMRLNCTCTPTKGSKAKHSRSWDHPAIPTSKSNRSCESLAQVLEITWPINVFVNIVGSPMLQIPKSNLQARDMWPTNKNHLLYFPLFWLLNRDPSNGLV